MIYDFFKMYRWGLDWNFVPRMWGIFFFLKEKKPNAWHFPQGGGGWGSQWQVRKRHLHAVTPSREWLYTGDIRTFVHRMHAGCYMGDQLTIVGRRPLNFLKIAFILKNKAVLRNVYRHLIRARRSIIYQMLSYKTYPRCLRNQPSQWHSTWEHLSK